MSGIFGTYSRSGDAASLSLFGEIQHAMFHWVPDRQDEVLRQHACLGHMLRETTPEDAFDDQPRSYSEFRSEWIVTADVRLDNRDDLLERLQEDPLLAKRPPEAIPDSDILLAAYRAWGEDCPGELLGDFAFAVWDVKKRELFCARDHLGVKPFYFYDDGDLFCFANDIRGLAEMGGGRLDQDAVASYLRIGELLDEDRTFLKGIRKLPPASSIKVSANELKQSRFWRFEDIEPLRDVEFADQVQHLRQLLQEAVRVRLRRTGPITCHLSGGLDSSLVTAMAAELDDPRDFLSFNWVHPPGPDDEPGEVEWANSRKLAQKLGIRHEYIPLEPDDLDLHLDRSDLVTHTTSDAFYEGILRSQAASAGSRVVLSGWGGDELISYSGRRRYSDEFFRGNLFAALGGLWNAADPGKRRPRQFAASCYRELVRPVLRTLLPSASRKDFSYAGCASPEVASLVRKQSRGVGGREALTVRAEQISLLRQGHLQNRMESWANAGRADGVEYRYPLLDKRVVEFALSLPAQSYREGKLRRRIMREVSKGLLPEDIRLHESKLEIRRVNNLLEQLEAACSRQFEVWNAEGVRFRNKDLISQDLLAALVDSIGSQPEPGLRERVRRCVTVYKSLLVLNAGGVVLSSNGKETGG